MMNFKKIYNFNAGSVCCGLAAAFVLLGCSDWDEHFDTNSQIVPTADRTIWQNIVERPDLTQFKALAEKAGFAGTLDEVNSYTVWAPQNGSFDYDSINALSDVKLLKEFVQNHVAHYSYSISGSDSMRVVMLNEKKKYYVGRNGRYTIGGVAVSEPNIAGNNGFLHVTSAPMLYRASIFESLNSELYPIDSISDYIHGYDVRELDLSQSTEGPIVDGERTYLDSVYVEYNRYLLNGPFINEEDSSYTMIVPDNEAWEKARNVIKKYYNYIPTFKYLDGTADSERNKNTKETVPINANYLRDSLATRMVMANLFINNNIKDNGKLNHFTGNGALGADSLVFTNGTTVYRNDAEELMKGMKRHETSNGYMFVTDTLRWQPWNSWNPVIKIEGEAAEVSNSDGVVSYNRERVGLGQQNPAVSGTISNRMFLNVTARANKNPKIDFYLPNLRSTEYNVFVVVLPNNITNIYDPVPRKNQLQFIIGNNDADGNLTTWGWQNQKLVQINNNRIGSFLGDVVENDPTKVDTLYVGTLSFPIAYSGYSGTGNFNPFLRIEDCVERWTGQVTSDLRLDCIILVPTELDAFLREHPGYYANTGKTPIPMKPEE